MSEENIAEQEQELEVLQSIYPEELELHSDQHFVITLPLNDLTSSPNPPSVVLEVRYMPDYPSDSLPELKVGSIPNEREEEDDEDEDENKQDDPEFNDSDYRVLEGKLKEVGEENMVVTPERFLAWKAKFDVEMAALRAAEKKAAEEKALGRGARNNTNPKKLTGKELFETNKDLIASDAQYLEEGDVEVDLSQFERVKIRDEEEEEQRLAFSDEEDEGGKKGKKK
ncbi:hypothetical protein YB2330_005965 [Saitoella coloradoensis]